MDSKYFPEDFSIKSFIENYVSEMFTILGDKKEIYLSEFETNLRSSLSKKLNIDIKIIGVLHHSFHWTFFNNGNDIFELYSSGKKGEELKIRVKKEYSIGNARKYISVIESNLGKYMQDKCNNIKDFI